MFWKRNNYPRFLHHPSAGMPAAAQQVFGLEAEGSTAEETWIAAWPTFLSIVTATGDRQDYEWFEFESAAWDQESRLLSLTFVDSSQQNRELHLPERADEVLLTMIHERIERSIVCQKFRRSPIGSTCPQANSPQIRRNPLCSTHCRFSTAPIRCRCSAKNGVRASRYGWNEHLNCMQMRKMLPSKSDASYKSAKFLNRVCI